MLYESDTYFERCYGADFAVEIPRNQKEACWQAWIAHYTRQQPAHRVDYALARIESLQNGEPFPVLPGLPYADLDAGAFDARVVASSAGDGGGNPSDWLISPITQGDAAAVPGGCTHYCEGYASSCSARCAVANTSCEVGCKRERAICLAGCY